MSISLSENVIESLRCPICRARIKFESGTNQFQCISKECGASFPVIKGLPILINEASSIFSINEIALAGNMIAPSWKSKAIEILKHFVPSISLKVKSEINYIKFAKLLLGLSANPRVLVIGGRVLGTGMEALLACSSIELVESDVAFGPRTKLIFDAHDIPFDDRSFDGVICQVVLEHVINPQRCVEEIYRVLRDDGLVYAETAFMQQVHEGRYDFTRFTHLGHRYLFRRFEEICSGSVCGAGMALAWSYQYFLLSFVRSQFLKNLIKCFAHFTAFYLKYFDCFLIDKPGTFDAASEYFFLGRKSTRTISGRELIMQYRGMQR